MPRFGYDITPTHLKKEEIMEKIRLELIGITYNQIESGVYAVILQQAGGTRRIPIVIGFPEAQAIECKLQEVITPRPLTHDLMVNVMSTFGIELQEVHIHRLRNGVFAAELLLKNEYGEQIIDSRSSDAIALAIRVDAPIYTTPEVLEEAGFEPGERNGNDNNGDDTKSTETKKRSKGKDDYTRKSVEELKAMMQKAAETENYEEAGRIKRELDRRSAE